jgi:hypothetical protein
MENWLLRRNASDELAGIRPASKAWARKKNDRDGWFTVAQVGSVS